MYSVYGQCFLTTWHKILLEPEGWLFVTRANLFVVSPQVHVKSESLAIKISQEINYAKSLYYEQQLMLPPSENEDSLLLDS